MENSNKIAKFWREYEGELAGDVLTPEILRLARKYIGTLVLDVGAGSGALIKEIPAAVGIDIAPKNQKVLQGDISRLPFSDGSFDTVFATEVLEHLDDDILDRGLDEVRRVLQGGGIFIITTPYREDLERNVVVHSVGGKKFHRWGHFQSFDEEKMRRLLEAKGFAIVAMEHYPLAFMATYPVMKHVWKVIQVFRKFRSVNLFVVAKRKNG